MAAPSPTTPPSRPNWGCRLSLLTAGVAVGFFGLQHLSPLGVSSHSSPAESHIQTYCYQGVRTVASYSTNNQDANCFSVDEDGKFAAVFQPTEEDGYEIRKGYVLPGLWDGHGHLIQYGEFLHSADLFGAASMGEVRDRLAGYLERNPGVGGKENWVRGVGWDQMVLGGMPSAAGIPFTFLVVGGVWRGLLTLAWG